MNPSTFIKTVLIAVTLPRFINFIEAKNLPYLSHMVEDAGKFYFCVITNNGVKFCLFVNFNLRKVYTMYYYEFFNV